MFALELCPALDESGAPGGALQIPKQQHDTAGCRSGQILLVRRKMHSLYDTLSRTGASVKANREAMAEYQRALATGRRFKF